MVLVTGLGPDPTTAEIKTFWVYLMGAEPNLHSVVPDPPLSEHECLFGLVMVCGQGCMAFVCMNSSPPKAVSKFGLVVQSSYLQLREVGTFRWVFSNLGIHVDDLPLETPLSAHGGSDKSKVTSFYVDL